MGFFGMSNYTKEGPGVPKNGPKKRPFVVFFEIYARKFWNIMVAGLLWVLVDLPLITRGWADAGLTFITRNYSREKHAFVREDFFETIKKNRGQAFWIGLINQLITGVMLYNIITYALGLFPALYALLGVDIATVQQLKPLDPRMLDYIIMACTMFGYLVFTWMKYYIPFLVITFRLSTKQIYKNAFLFAVVGLKTNLLISAVLLLVYGLMVGAFLLIPTPLTLVILFLIWLLLIPGFRSLLIQFSIFPLIKKLMIDPYYKDNPHADKQARIDLNLEVEEDPAQPQEEQVFSDERLVADKEQPTFPRQYTEEEMRRLNRRIIAKHNSTDDDDTI